MPRAGQAGESGHARLEHVHGDGCHLPFADKAFDIVFSNSVIEHVGGPEAQARFAREIIRAGRGYWVQTPNRYFPVETHLLTPFVHLLPRTWRAFIVRRFTVWQWIHRPDPEAKRYYIEHFVSDIRLLSAVEIQHLFPDAVILRERFLGFTKSLVAYRLP
jgi:SAM-dependent methyltransferase